MNNLEADLKDIRDALFTGQKSERKAKAQEAFERIVKMVGTNLPPESDPEDVNSSTEYHVIRARPERFAWGKIVRWHELGDNKHIVEYLPFRGHKKLFSVYVNKSDTMHGFFTLEKAAIFAIAYAYNHNEAHWLTNAAARLLGADE